VCAECAAKLASRRTQESRGGYSYYHCPAAAGTNGYSRDCTQKRYFRVEHVDAVVWEWIKRMLTDPDQLLDGIRAEQRERSLRSQPIRDRLAVVEKLVTEEREKLARLLELYLAGEFDKALLDEQRSRLEGTVHTLEREQKSLQDMLTMKTISDEQLRDVQQYAEEVSHGLGIVDADFDTKTRVAELLDVEVCLGVDQEGQWAEVKAIVGKEKLRIGPTNTDRCSGTT
jgi:site-specific DNA recombinase